MCWADRNKTTVFWNRKSKLVLRIRGQKDGQWPRRKKFRWRLQISLQIIRKAPAKRANILPGTLAADTCFPNVSQFNHTGICFCRQAETCFAAGNNASRVEKLGNIVETRVRNKFFWQHVSSFCRSLRKVSCPVNALPNRDADDAILKLGSAFGQNFRDLLRSLWSRSNLFKSQRKFSHGLATQCKSTQVFHG